MINLEKAYRGNLDWLVGRTIFCTVHGSHAYGTNMPESDIDIKGVCVPPKQYFHGFKHRFEQAEQSDPYDMVIYDIRKFFELAGNCNPNIIEVLFTNQKHWVKTTEAGKLLYNNRYLFLSAKAKHTFSGYAHAQLKRIKSHRAWLMNPPKKKPTREDFGLPTQNKISASVRGAFEKLETEGHKFDKDVMRILTAEKRYHAALREWQQYENWKKNRNPKRAALEAKYTFDCKHAAHLVRLLRMGKEILTRGEVVVKRPDAKTLLAIRNGEWSYDKIVAYAEEMDNKLNDLYESKNYSLPRSPNWKKLDSLCQQIVEMMI